MSPETPYTTESEPPRSVFPIDAEIVYGRVAFNDELTVEERRVLQDGNLESLEADDPLRYLLESRAHPELLDGDQHDYNTGVLIAHGAVQRQKRLLRAEGIDVPEPKFDPEVDGPAFYLPRANPKQPPIIRNISLRLRQISHMYGRVSAYVETENKLSIRGLFGGRQTVSGMSFVTEQQFDAKNIDALALGMGDAFQLYYGQYGGTYNKPTIQVGKAHPLDRWRRSQKQDDWLEAGIPSMEMYDRTTDIFRTRLRTPTYRARMPRPAIPGMPEAASEEIHARVRWNGVVPANAQVTHVGSFDSQTVMERKHGEAYVEDIADRYTDFEHQLVENDVLIVRGNNGGLYPLRSPFVVDPKIAGRIKGVVPDVVALQAVCSYGSTRLLMDAETFDIDQLKELVDLTDHITERQLRTITTAQKLRRLIFEENMPFDFPESLNGYLVGETIEKIAHMPTWSGRLGFIALMWLYVKRDRQRPGGAIAHTNKSKKTV